MSGWADPVRIFMIRTYQKKAPDKIPQIPKILRKYEGQKLFLVKEMMKKYKLKKTDISKNLRKWLNEREPRNSNPTVRNSRIMGTARISDIMGTAERRPRNSSSRKVRTSATDAELLLRRTPEKSRDNLTAEEKHYARLNKEKTQKTGAKVERSLKSSKTMPLKSDKKTQKTGAKVERSLKSSKTMPLKSDKKQKDRSNKKWKRFKLGEKKKAKKGAKSKKKETKQGEEEAKEEECLPKVAVISSEELPYGGSNMSFEDASSMDTPASPYTPVTPLEIPSVKLDIGDADDFLPIVPVTPEAKKPLIQVDHESQGILAQDWQEYEEEVQARKIGLTNDNSRTQRAESHRVLQKKLKLGIHSGSRSRSQSTGMIYHKQKTYGTAMSDIPFIAEEIISIDPLTLLQRSTGALKSMHSLFDTFQNFHPEELSEALHQASESVARRSRSCSTDSNSLDSEEMNLASFAIDSPPMVQEISREPTSLSPDSRQNLPSINKNNDVDMQAPLNKFTPDINMPTSPPLDIIQSEKVLAVVDSDEIIDEPDPEPRVGKLNTLRKPPKLTSFDSVSNLMQMQDPLGMQRRDTIKLINKYEGSTNDFAPLLKQEMEEDPTMWLLSWSAQESLQSPADVAEMLKHLERTIVMIEKYIPTCNDLLHDDESTKVYFTAVIQELLKRAQQKNLLKGVQQDWSLWAGADLDKVKTIVAEDIDRMVRYMAWIRNNIRASNVTDYNDAQQACQGAVEIKNSLKMILSKQLEHDSSLREDDIDI